MPAHFKKRRGPQGPNKNEEKVLRARRAENQGLFADTLGSKFPAIKRLKIHLVFLGANESVIEEKDLSFGPQNPALFTAPCPGRCGQGSFDFGGKVEETAAASLPLSESSAKCAQPLYASSTQTCGCEARCRMEIEYLPMEKPLATS